MNGETANPAGSPWPGDDRAVSVVVPVYREAANIEALARAVDAALSPRGFEWELLLVDDDSRDGSEEAARSLAVEFPLRFEARRAPARDLSLSVLRGLRLARYDRVVVMDADLSHPPKRIPALLEAVDKGVIAVGSRYAPGGSLDRNWRLSRRLISRAATLLSGPLVSCADPMSGFFALDRRSLPDTAALSPLGYKIGLELIVRGNLAVREVPIEFSDRRRGSSKLNWREQWKFLRHLFRLYRFRWPRLSRLGCYGLVGTSGFAVDVLCWQLLQWIGFDHRWARFLSFWPAVTWNWRWNRVITFDDRPPAPKARQWLQFIVASQVGMVTNVGAYLGLTAMVGIFDKHRLLAMIAGVVAGMVANFTVADHYVFRVDALARRQSRRGGAGVIES